MRLIGTAILLGMLGWSQATAQTGGRVLSRPEEASPRGDNVAPPAAPERFLELRVAYRVGTIYNPLTGKHDKVRLRAYTDANAPAAAHGSSFIAPTLSIRPGETMRIALHNGLPDDPGCVHVHDVNTPHCFNRTNIHTHGLWISPSGNSDNVLLTLHPGQTFHYEYNLAADHPSGTFWYHPHVHGATSVQVASGMAGVLIVRGARQPTAARPGDVDTILKHEDGSAFRERVLLFQQIQYACRDETGAIKKDPRSGAWICDASGEGDGAIGKIEPRNFDLFTRTSWKESGRFTSINGQTFPVLASAKVGRPERWRLVHAGVRETIGLQIRKMRKGARAPDPATAKDAARLQVWLSANCPGESLAQFGFASDGLTREKVVERQATILQPGYREDLLVAFPEPGDYCLIDKQSKDPTSNINGLVERRNYLGRIHVEPAETLGADPKTTIRAALVAAADRFIVEPAIREKVMEDLNAGDDLLLTSFVPHKTISDSEIAGEQEVRFSIVGTPPQFRINEKPFRPGRIDRRLPLGRAERWTLTAADFSHPFHIHVNPFQIVSIKDQNGKEVSLSGEAEDLQYRGLQGVWKDTLFVKSGHTIVVKMRYERYVGQFVAHCHILDHQDRGMMENIRIELPGDGGHVMPAGRGHGIAP